MRETERIERNTYKISSHGAVLVGESADSRSDFQDICCDLWNPKSVDNFTRVLRCFLA
jgi:hypothetical protein